MAQEYDVLRIMCSRYMDSYNIILYMGMITMTNNNLEPLAKPLMEMKNKQTMFLFMLYIVYVYLLLRDADECYPPAQAAARCGSFMFWYETLCLDRSRSCSE